jgi:hypothetical protein
MQRNLILALASFSAFVPSRAQMHKVAKPEEVVRAVGVYEWIGDRAKPTATRLIPVSLYIDGAFQDAGVYLSRPIPFALDTGTIYEVDKSGVPGGTVELTLARHLKAIGDSPGFDDGWVGYGKFAIPPVKKVAPLKQTKATATITSDKPDKDSDRPTFSRRVDHSDPTSTSTTGSSASTEGTNATADPGPAPPDDPDRPHLSKKSDSNSAPTPPPTPADNTPDKPDAEASTTPPVTSTSSPNADRPTLRKRSPEEAKKARKEAQESSASGLATSLNDDPNRPTLHRGSGQRDLTEADLPTIKGVPVDLHQAIAVSDANNRPVHDFSRPWADDAERASVLAKMQELARAQLAAYRSSNPSPAATPAKPALRRPNSKLRHSTSPESVPPAEPLLDEQLSGYTLSYGGAATYVYTAHTGGEGNALRYVTVVVQRDTLGELRPAIQSVTDAAHLDRTPWMRLVDVVDADASNRASLLFELRGETARQFALYRVIATRPEEIFLTGTTQ